MLGLYLFFPILKNNFLTIVWMFKASFISLFHILNCFLQPWELEITCGEVPVQVLCMSTWEFRENTKYPKAMIKINQYSNPLTKGAKV